MQPLKTALLQTSLHWENVDANLAHFDALLETVKVDTDLILLPEMFTTGFSMNPERFAAYSLEKGLPWLQVKAKEHNCVVAGSMMVEEDGNYYNRLYYVFPDGTFSFYDKAHLFSMGGEHEHYTAGTQKLIVSVKGWRLKPLVCYDLRFPVWCRNVEDYDVLIFHANFPEKRIHHWNILLQARALENLSYVAAVNRIGEDGNGVTHNGSSQVIAPDGEVLYMKKGEDAILYATLSKETLLQTRERFPFLQDRGRV